MMNSNPINVDEHSLDKLYFSFDKFQGELLNTVRDGLKNFAQMIIADAQKNLKRKKAVGSNGRRDNNVASGSLIESGAVKEMANLEILAGFPMSYAYYVEFGRRAGGYPPYWAIYEWVKKKHITADDEEAREIAGMIRTKIGKQGTRPYPFLRPAFEKRKKSISAFMAKAAKSVMNKDYTK